MSKPRIEKDEKRKSLAQAHFQLDNEGEVPQSQGQEQRRSVGRKGSRPSVPHPSRPSDGLTSSPSTTTIAEPEDQFNKKLLLLRLRNEQDARNEPRRTGRSTMRRSVGPNVNRIRTSLLGIEEEGLGQDGQNKNNSKNTLRLYSSSRDHRASSVADISAVLEEAAESSVPARRSFIMKKPSDRLGPNSTVAEADSPMNVGAQSKRTTPVNQVEVDKPVPLLFSRYLSTSSNQGSPEPDPDDEQNFWLKPLLTAGSGYGQYETSMDDPLLENVRSEIIPRDRRIQINVIPADVVGVVEQGVKWWEWNRVMFLYLFGTAVTLYLGILTMTGLNTFIILTEGENHIKMFLIHSSLMIAVMLGLGAFGLIIYRLFPEKRKSTLTKCHAWIFVLLILVLLGGYGIGFQASKDVTGQTAHFYTLHSIIGTALAGILIFETGSGVYMYWKGRELGLSLTHKKYDAWVNYHTYFGFLTFVIGGLCCITGHMTPAGRKLEGVSVDASDLHKLFVLISNVLTVFFIFTVVHMASTHRFAQRSKPEWDTVFGRSTIWEEDQRIDDPGVTLGQWVRDNFKDGQRYLHDLHYHHHNFYTN